MSNRIGRKTRARLVDTGWHEYPFSGHKGRCCICFVSFAHQEMIWGHGSTHTGFYHGRCLGGLLQYAPMVFGAINDRLVISDDEAAERLADTIAVEVVRALMRRNMTMPLD